MPDSLAPATLTGAVLPAKLIPISEATAQVMPKAEVFFGYGYIRFNSGTTAGPFNMNGGGGSVAVNLNRWFGMVTELGAYHGVILGKDCNVVSYTAGPRFAYRAPGKTTLFGQTLFGGTNVTGLGPGPQGSQARFTMMSGGGMDVRANSHLAIRAFQAEYFMANIVERLNARQNNARISTGIVFYWNPK